jgi:S-adenosylmethionine synthetase
MRSSYLFTSESVSEGHPDKVSDQISDAIVDLFLSKDPEARIACETLTTTQLVVLAGEIRGKGIMDEAGNWAPGVQEEVEQTVRETVKDIGYEQDGFHWEKAKVEILLHSQSADIAQGVDAAEKKDEGAGDQGIMFGYACDETPDLMPAPLDIRHIAFSRGISAARRCRQVAPFARAGRQEPGHRSGTRTASRSPSTADRRLAAAISMRSSPPRTCAS